MNAKKTILAFVLTPAANNEHIKEEYHSKRSIYKKIWIT